MFIAELFESTAKNLVVVYPGRFQPFHKGHKAVYDGLVAKYGRDHVWIATSNKTDNLKSPFSFGDKLQFMAATGVSADRVIESTQPYRPVELLNKFDPAHTIVIFAVSEKDMAEDPRFSFFKKDGSPAHFQPLPKDIKDCLPLAQHSYIEVVPTVNFKVLGQPMRSATEVRAQYRAADDATKQAIIKDLFGTYTPELKHILDTKLATSVNEHIVKVGSKYRLVSKHGNKNLGTYDTKAGAEKRERQVQYFKHAGVEEGEEDDDGRPEHLKGVKKPSWGNDESEWSKKMKQQTKDAEDEKKEQGVAEGWKEKAAAAALASTMAAGAGGVVVNPNRVIDAQGHSAANPYGNTDSMGNPIKKSTSNPDSERLKKNTEIVDKEQQVNHHKLKELRLFHPADNPGKVNVYYRPGGLRTEQRRVIAKEIPYRTVDILTKGLVRKYGIDPKDLEIVPVSDPHGERLREFAPGNGDDDRPTAEYEVYQCQPDNQFDWIGGPLGQTDSMGEAHSLAYELWKKHPDKCFMVWQERSQGSRGGYGPKGSVLGPDEEVDEGKFGLGGPAVGAPLASTNEYNRLSGASKLRHDASVALKMVDSLKHTNRNGHYDEEIKKYLQRAQEYLAKAKEIELGVDEGTVVSEDAAGVGVVATNKKMAKDPRYSTSMTVDVHPDTPAKNLKAFNLIGKGKK